MVLTNKQLEGIRIIKERYQHGEHYTVIAGYAGAGKSTLIKFAVDALGFNLEEVAYVAYTGKAANVLKNKGCPNATTAHKLLYYAHQTKDGNYVFKPKPSLDAMYKLIVVDEVSMLPLEMWNLLLSHNVYILASGDPAQLPPPKDETNWALEKPHIFLDEIMRQAQDSAIIRLSMHIREGKDFTSFQTVPGEVRIIHHRYSFTDEDITLQQASQVICGTNAQRFELNNRIRNLQGRGPEPEPGDKIVSLKNHWGTLSTNNLNALTNGSIGEIIDYKHKLQTYPNTARFKSFEPTDLIYTSIITDDGEEFENLPIDYKCLTTNTPSLNGQQEFQLGGYNKYLINKIINSEKNIDYMLSWVKDIPYQFNYGYAITCWKAQGSEYENVLGYDCTWLKRKNSVEYIQYLYTLVTRASKRIILVGD